MTKIDLRARLCHWATLHLTIHPNIGLNPAVELEHHRLFWPVFSTLTKLVTSFEGAVVKVLGSHLGTGSNVHIAGVFSNFK